MSADPSSASLSGLLDTFRPSDRTLIRAVMQTSEGEQIVYSAVRAFVDGWEGAETLDDYSIFRIGAWLHRNATARLRAALLGWSAVQDTPAWTALFSGLAGDSELVAVRPQVAVSGAGASEQQLLLALRRTHEDDEPIGADLVR